MDLQFDINLRRSALLVLAQTIWEQETVKNKVKSFILQSDGFETSNKWNKLAKEVMINIPRSLLPCHLYSELLQAVKDTGARIYDWYKFLGYIDIFGEYTEDVYNNYLKRIYWTYYGTIDEVKTLKLFWFNNPNIEVIKLFRLACRFCCKDLIDELWDRLPENYQSSDHSSYFRNESFYVLAYWIYYKKSCLNNFVDDLKRLGKYNGISQNTEEILMLTAARTHNYCVAKYFCKKLQPETMLSLFRGAGPEYFEKINNRQYIEDGCVELNQNFFHVSMPSYHFRNFLTMLMSAYPWQELFVPAFRQLQEFLSDGDVISIVLRVVKSILINSNDDIKADDYPMQMHLTFLWKTLLAKYKLPAAKLILNYLCHLSDERNLKIIFNDRDLIEKRAELLEICFPSIIRKLGDGKNKNKIERFINEFLIFSEWEVDVKEKVTKIYDFIINHYNVDAAIEYLNSTCETDGERKNILEKINHVFLCYYLAHENLEEALNKYSEWIFPVETEKFKRTFIDKPTTLNLIYKFWYRSQLKAGWIEAALNKTNTFLNWIFSSNETEINYFKKKIVADLKANDWKNLRHHFLYSNDFEIISTFLHWCSCSFVEIEEVKKNCLKKHLHLQCEKLVTSDKLNRVMQLVQWFYKQPEEREKFLDDLFQREPGQGCSHWEGQGGT